MNKPCSHCEKAIIDRVGYFKCDTPCNNAKRCYENDVKLLDVLRGYMPDIQYAKSNDGILSTGRTDIDFQKSCQRYTVEDALAKWGVDVKKEV